MPAHARYREDELVGIVKKTIEEIKGDGLFYPDITASTLIQKIQIKYPDITRYYIDLPCCKEILFKYRKERAEYIESNLTSEKSARKILTTTNKVDRYMKANNYNVNDAFLAYEIDVRDATEALFAELRKERRRNENLREIIQAKDNGNSRFDALIRKKEEIINLFKSNHPCLQIWILIFPLHQEVKCIPFLQQVICEVRMDRVF